MRRTDAATGATSEIAELEIAFIASHSASCKIVAATETIAVGDLVIPGPLPPSAALPAGAGSAGAPTGAPVVPGQKGKPPGWNPAEHTDYSGSLALRYQGFKDGGPAGRDFNQESALVNIYAGHIGGSKFDFRLRGTASREQIQLSSGRSESRDNDRLYEATLSYEPPEARFTYQVGRLISGPLVGFDYLDGGVGEFHATRRFSLGAFYGSRSNGDQINFASPGRAYGAFVHWLDQSPGKPFYAEYLLRGDRRLPRGRYQPGVPVVLRPAGLRQPLVALRARRVRPRPQLARQSGRQQQSAEQRPVLRQLQRLQGGAPRRELRPVAPDLHP